MYIPSLKKVKVSRDLKFLDDSVSTKLIRSHTGCENNIHETNIEVSSSNNDSEVDGGHLNNEGSLVEDEYNGENASVGCEPEITDDDDDSESNGQTTPRRSSRSNKGVPPRRLIEEINIVINGEPSTYKDAISCCEKDKWIHAMEEEISSLKANETWQLVELPPGKNVVGCKWVYKIKSNASGGATRFKARLVAQGFSQKFGVDYDQVFAPVARQTTFRVFLSAASSRGMEVHHFDAKTAFLNGELNEEIFMRQPPGFTEEDQENMVCRLNKSIYGLKQSAKVWNEKLHNVLISANMTQCNADSCLYVYHRSQVDIYVLIYVDDILVASTSIGAIKTLEQILKANFDIENLGEVTSYLGIRVLRQNGCYLLDQQSYITNIANRFGLSDAKISDIPISPSYQKEKNGDDNVLPSNDKYRAAIGHLLYIAINTRPDIAASVCILSQKVSSPTSSDWNEVKRLIRYLRGSSSLRLKLGGIKDNENLFGFADANWAEDTQERKSNSGYIFILGGPISWSCKRQDCVALSSTEAEFISLSEACRESIWLQRLLIDFNWRGDSRTKIYEDNQSVLKLIVDEKLSNRTKHIDTRKCFVRDFVVKKQVICEYCPTETMLADLLIKGFPKARFITLRNRCNLVNID